MTVYYNKPTTELYVDDEFDGYDTEEIEFNVTKTDVIKCVFNRYYKKYDYQTFKMMINEFDIELDDYLYDEDIQEDLYEIYFD